MYSVTITLYWEILITQDMLYMEAGNKHNSNTTYSFSHGNVTMCKLKIIHLYKITRVRWRFCDVAHKHSCPLRISPLENILKFKHLFISRVRIEIILLYGELSFINACCRADAIFNSLQLRRCELIHRNLPSNIPR